MDRKSRDATGACCSGMIVALLMLASTAAMAKVVPEAKIEQLTDLIVGMMPLGPTLDAQHGDASWPLQGKVDKVSTEQLACMRSELSSDGYRRTVQQRVRTYAKERPSRIDDDIKILNDGAANLFGKMVQGGAAKDASESMNADQLLSFTLLMNDAKYLPLRELIGFGDAFDMNASPQENGEAGRRFGASFALRLMLTAMSTCEIKPAAVL